MNFGMITLNQSTRTEQNYATRILMALLFMSKPKIFIKAFADDVKKWFDSPNTMKMKDCFQQVRAKKLLVFLKMNQEERL